MSNNRRDFLKISGLAGMGLVGAGISGFSQPQLDEVLHQSKRQRNQRFNMSGYAAPKIDVVRIGFVGLGSRGPGAVDRISKLRRFATFCLRRWIRLKNPWRVPLTNRIPIQEVLLPGKKCATGTILI